MISYFYKGRVLQEDGATAQQWRRMRLPGNETFSVRWAQGRGLQQSFALGTLLFCYDHFELQKATAFSLALSSYAVLYYPLDDGAHYQGPSVQDMALSPRYHYLCEGASVKGSQLILPSGCYRCFYICLPAELLQDVSAITLPLRTRTGSVVRAILDEILNCRLEDFALSLFLRARVTELLRLCLEQPVETGNAAVNRQRMEMVRQYMDGHPAQPLQDKGLAALYGSSVSVFRKAFRAYFKMTPHQYVLTARMERAKYLLLHTDATVEAIAWEVGYADTTGFYRVFARHFRHTPKDLRDNNLT